MDYCDCGAPLDFSPDGVHCVHCYEALASRGERLGDVSCTDPVRAGYVRGVLVGCGVILGVVVYWLLLFVTKSGSPACVLVGVVAGVVGGIVAWGLLGYGERLRRGER